MAKKKKRIKPITGMPILGIDEDGNLNIDINAAKKAYNKQNKGTVQIKGFKKRTIDRYKKVYHQFEILKKKYSSKTKAELYELLATKDYDGKTYSRNTIRNIIEDKKYNLNPSR
tara:strand:- start:890 stop:1231 length:342 start_codon:yes stop_codon:yes gene_type:complete